MMGAAPDHGGNDDDGLGELPDPDAWLWDDSFYGAN
jgi:hypothetical protein